MINWRPNEIDNQLIALAFQEDLGFPYSDVTTDILFENGSLHTQAKVISKHTEPIVVCGLSIIPLLFSALEDSVKITSTFKDGDLLETGEVLVSITGPAKTLLRAERTLLNFLQRLCAVATLTKKFTDIIQHTSTKVLDTRKTMPGFRHLDKYAVQCGGGVNHRMGLYDAVMIKDTHVDSIGGMAKAIAKLPNDVLTHYPVIVEVRDMKELQIVLNEGLHKTSRVLLDNMSNDELKACVELCAGKISTEASGNINIDNVADIAATGVDFVSIGKITHSANNVNLSMKCDL